jgi:outer membrane protein TolC
MRMKTLHHLILGCFGTAIALGYAPAVHGEAAPPSPQTADALLSELGQLAEVPQSVLRPIPKLAFQPIVKTAAKPIALAAAQSSPQATRLPIVTETAAAEAFLLQLDPLADVPQSVLRPLPQRALMTAPPAVQPPPSRLAAEPIRTTAPPPKVAPLGTPKSPTPPAVTPSASPSFDATPTPMPGLTPAAPASPAQVAPAPVASPTPSATPSQMPSSAPVKIDPNAPPPDYLNPHPNPLRFPTRSAEVKLEGNQPISLQQAIELAERNSLTLKEAQIQAEQTVSALRQAQAALFPTLSTQFDLNRQQSASGQISKAVQDFNQQNVPVNFRQDTSGADPVTTSFSGTLQLSYNIFTSGQRAANIRAAKYQVRAGDLGVEQAREQLRLDTASAYYDLQNADAQIDIFDKAIQVSEANVRDNQARERAGVGTRFDVLQAQVQLSNNQQRRITAIATQQTSRRQLAQLLNLPLTIGIVAADAIIPAGTWPLTLEESIVMAFKNRVELENQLVQRDISKERRKSALSALGPTVTVSAQYNVLKQFEQPVGGGDGYAFQAQVSFPLFDGGAARAIAAQRAKDGELAENRFAQQRNTVRFQIEQAYFNLVANQANISTTDQAVVQAEEALRLAKLRSDAGVGTQTERLQAESDLVTARGNRLTAIVGYNRSLAQLRRYVSNLSTDRNRSLTR